MNFPPESSAARLTGLVAKRADISGQIQFWDSAL
jgi:hypothetical protein